MSIANLRELAKRRQVPTVNEVEAALAEHDEALRISADSRARLLEENQKLRNELAAAVDRAEKAEAQAAAMRAALEKVEWLWIGTSNQAGMTELICPWCKNSPDSTGVEYSKRGHKPDCKRQRAL